MRNLTQRNGVYVVRVQLPADVRESFGKTAEVRSLRTRDPHQALERVGPMIADIKRQIEKVRRGGKVVQPSVSTPAPAPVASWSTAQRAIIVAQVGDGAVDLLVEAVSDIPAIDEREIQPAPEGCESAESHLLGGVLTLDGRMDATLAIAGVVPRSLELVD